MKIALFHELPMGGARVAANNFAKFLRKDYIVDLYTVSNKENKEEHKYYSQVFYYRFLSHGLSNNGWLDRIRNDTTDLVRLYLLHKKIAEQINRQKYDIVFVHASMFTQAPFILHFLKPRKIYYCQETLRTVYEEGFAISKNIGFLKYHYEKNNRRIRKIIDSMNIGKADLILTNSKFTQSLISKNYKLKSKVVYLGVDSSFFKPLKFKKDIDIFFIGGKNKINGYDMLEGALNILKKRKIRLEVLSEKWISDEELLRTYNRSKIVANLEYNQPFGLIALESMACCVPVIVLNQAAYKETVVNGLNGYLINNPKELAKRVSMILDNRLLAERIGKEGRKIVMTKWDWKIRIKTLNNIFNEA